MGFYVIDVHKQARLIYSLELRAVDACGEEERISDKGDAKRTSHE